MRFVSLSFRTHTHIISRQMYDLFMHFKIQVAHSLFVRQGAMKTFKSNYHVRQREHLPYVTV